MAGLLEGVVPQEQRAAKVPVAAPAKNIAIVKGASTSLPQFDASKAPH
jgi:hypothetical protein